MYTAYSNVWTSFIVDGFFFTCRNVNSFYILVNGCLMNYQAISPILYDFIDIMYHIILVTKLHLLVQGR